MPLLYYFHVNLFAAPKSAEFACSWEDTAARLEQLPGIIFEPDGSFVITGSNQRAESSSTPIAFEHRTTRWQVDGHLFDFDGHLHRVELRGQCPPPIFDDLLRSVDWPAQSLLFEMVREGTTLDEEEFRGQAGAEDGPAR